MTDKGRVLQSEYMAFAKLETAAPFNLAASGVADCVLADIGASLADLALHGPNAYGYAPLVEKIAGRFRVDPACVVTVAGGCSFANHLAMAAIVAPGDEVVVEDPAYELLLSTLGYLRADVRRFHRRLEDAWRLDADALGAALTPRTRLVVATNLHNPTGALSGPAEVAAVVRAAQSVGARVLIDEVYLELMAREGEAPTAFTADGDVIVTSSLTKAYGLSGLRCGWVLAPADLAQKMRRLNDLYGVAAPHVTERLSLVAFDRLAALRARASATLEANRAAYREILGGHPALDQIVFEQGTTVFPKLRRGAVDQFRELLKARFETSVVPGRFFGRPDHIRVSLTGDPTMSREAYARLAAALDGCHRPASSLTYTAGRR
jgi:aspartate/methionine/tyrosine aminotransferase